MGDILHRKRKLINKIQAQDKQEEDFGLSVEECEQWSLLKLEVAEIIFQTEIYWWQRSRNWWIKNGDCNTKFFHICASNQKRKN